MLAVVVEAEFSVLVVLTLVLITGASAAVFFMTVRRWTTRRQWVSLSEWARRHAMKLAPLDDTSVPAPFDRLDNLNPQLRMCLRDRENRTTIAQLETHDALATSQAPARWNVLIRATVTAYSPAGLRPANVSASVVDLFHLTVFHSLATNRFTVVAEEARTAQALSRSSARALLPPDVGLLQIDRCIVLDFSSRPFDPVELDRMQSVADQVCQMC